MAKPAKIVFIEPMSAFTTRTLPEGPSWLYEISSSTVIVVWPATTLAG
jgi:hypothetical protein